MIKEVKIRRLGSLCYFFKVLKKLIAVATLNRLILRFPPCWNFDANWTKSFSVTLLFVLAATTDAVAHAGPSGEARHEFVWQHDHPHPHTRVLQPHSPAGRAERQSGEWRGRRCRGRVRLPLLRLARGGPQDRRTQIGSDIADSGRAARAVSTPASRASAADADADTVAAAAVLPVGRHQATRPQQRSRPLSRYRWRGVKLASRRCRWLPLTS